MNDVVSLLIAVVVTAIVLWLLSLVLPIWVAALIALVVFLALISGRLRF